MVDRARSRALGWGAAQRAVRLSSETVQGHWERFADFGTDDWRRIQRIVDQGEWIVERGEHRLFWIDEDGKPWAAVVKLTANDELYLVSYRRAQPREVRNWRALAKGEK